MQNNVISIGNTSLYGSQTSAIFFFVFKTAPLATELLVFMGPRPLLSFFAFKTAPLARELLVSMDPSPHLWFLHAKHILLVRDYKSLLVPGFACSFVNSKQRS